MTFSLIGFDPDIEMIGTAVSSKWTGVGGTVQYFRHHVGLVNIQNCSYAKTAYDILDGLEAGQDVAEATERAMALDKKAVIRQAIVCDLKGNMHVYAGEKCSRPYIQKIGENCAAAGNTLASTKVVDAMLSAFEEDQTLSLTHRILKALEAGQEAGGDKRGQEAAAIKSYKLEYPVQRFWPIDLRVDSHDRPLEELRRLFDIFDANERRVHF